MESLNKVYIVQYGDGDSTELGGIHYLLETAISEVEKNYYTHVVSGDNNDSGEIFILYRREDGENHPSSYAMIIEKKVQGL